MSLATQRSNLELTLENYTAQLATLSSPGAMRPKYTLPNGVEVDWPAYMKFLTDQCASIREQLAATEVVDLISTSEVQQRFGVPFAGF